MSEIVETEVFTFEELSDSAKAKAREWYCENGFDYPWWEGVYEQFEEVCALIGVDLDTHGVRLMGGGVRQKPSIYFRGFWSQGMGPASRGTMPIRLGPPGRCEAGVSLIPICTR